MDGKRGVKRKAGSNMGKRTKIEIKYVRDKTRRQAMFTKRKSGIMKKAHELTILTGCELLLLMVSEGGHAYTFCTNKFLPVIEYDENKKFIQDLLVGKKEARANSRRAEYEQTKQDHDPEEKEPEITKKKVTKRNELRQLPPYANSFVPGYPIAPFAMLSPNGYMQPPRYSAHYKDPMLGDASEPFILPYPIPDSVIPYEQDEDKDLQLPPPKR